MTAEDTWQVEVAYATPSRQEVIIVSVRPGATIEEVIRVSGILRNFPEIDLTRNPVGVYGELARLSDRVRDRDRVEIYRPLIAEPKSARRKRVARGGKRPALNNKHDIK